MAITVINRPLGHKLSDTEVDGDATDSSGDVLITTVSNHGLSDGSYVYVESNIESYNGFKYVDSVSYTTFKLKESENGDYVPFKQIADVIYRESVFDHGFQCVHLPIVYELESSIFPVNTEGDAYTPNTVVSFSNNNGNVELNLDNSLTDPVALTKIELVGTGPLAGVYQIITVVQAWAVVIDLDYDASYSFTGYTIVKYYDNYSINVNIYTGLLSGHRWDDEKPSALVATLRFIPDANNKVLFSISEILRGYIKTLNNLQLDTLPNNIDFMTEFYIGYYESYDESDGEEISTHEDGEVIDDFTGQAINAQNEFKNLYSGHLSEYVNDGNHLAEWLNDLDVPIAIVGYFFDISFILIHNGVDVVVTMFKALDGIVTETEILTITNPGKGVIRVPITAESGFDKYCIQASTPGYPAIPQENESISISAPNLWTSRNIDPVLVNWNGVPSVNLGDVSPWDETSEQLYLDYAFITGKTYTITANLSRDIAGSGAIISATTTLAVADGSFNTIESQTEDSSASYSVILTFVATSETSKLILSQHDTGEAVSFSETAFDSVSGTVFVAEIPAIDPQDLTEQICITILEECDSTFTEDARLLEAGDFRILE